MIDFGGWLEDDLILTAGNSMWMGMALPVMLLFLIMLCRRRYWGTGEWMMLGIALVALASLLHRGYWTVWRALGNNGYPEAAATWIESENALVFLSALTALGYVLHIKPYLSAMMGRFWLVYTAGYLAVMASIPFMTGG